MNQTSKIIDKQYLFKKIAFRKVKYQSHFTGLLFGFANAIPFFAQAALFSFGAVLVKRNQILFATKPV